MASKWLTWAVMIAGLTAVISGGTNPSVNWSIWLTSIGSAAVGATIGAFFVRLSAEDLMEDTKKILKNTLETKFSSNNNLDSEYKIVWYRYGIKQMDGEYKWNLNKIDFNECKQLSGMKSSVKVTDKNDKSHIYKIESAFRGEKFISFFHPPFGTESIAMEVIPFMGNSFENHQSGLILHQTWDGNHAISSVMMSRVPLFNIKKEGIIPNEFQKKMSELWVRNFKKNTPIFPLPDIHTGISFNIGQE